MLEPWIIDEILRKEREKREEQERQQPRIEIPADDPSRTPDAPEQPAERRPGYEMPNPNEPERRREERKDDEPKRGVETTRITGDDDDDGAIDILKKIKELEDKAPPAPAEKPAEKKPD